MSTADLVATVHEALDGNGSTDDALAALDALQAQAEAGERPFRDHVAWFSRAEAAEAERDWLREALVRIGAKQQETLETLRANGIVFDGPLGADPDNWQHVAFSIYTDLCEVDTWAHQALDDGVLS